MISRYRVHERVKEKQAKFVCVVVVVVACLECTDKVPVLQDRRHCSSRHTAEHAKYQGDMCVCV